MIRVLWRAFVVLGVILACALPSSEAQFGKNKIAYESFDWEVYEAPHFDVHYYESVEPFLEEIVSYAESAYVKISKDLDHELRFRVPLIVYKTHGEFEQTNVTLSEVPEYVGAFAEPIQYRMVLPIDQPPDKLYKLIAHELTHIFQYSMLYDGYLGRTIRGRPPLWLMEGMASYLADDEDNLDQMAIRDAVVNNILPPVEELNVLSFLTYRYGHAIFEFIEQEHGKEGLRSFLFEFKKVLLTGNIGKAIKESFGYDVDEFNRRFNRYLRKKYFPILLEKKSPDDYGKEIGLKRRGSITFGPTLSPSGELIAALSAPKMELDLVVLSAEDGERVKNLTKGWTNRYASLVSEAFDGKRDLSWSPNADQIAVFARKEDRFPLLIFNALNGKLLREIVPPKIYECASPSFSPDGKRVAFEGNRDGIVDIFEIDLETREIRSLTQDEFFDANPWYAADGRTLLYNRRIGSHWKIFSVDLNDATKKTQLTFGATSDIQPSYSRDGKSIYFSSDRGPDGVFNIHSLDLESGDLRQHTDLVGGAFTPLEMAERDDERFLVYTAFFNGSFRLYRMPLTAPEETVEATQRMLEPVEAEPFRSALQLKVDEDKKQDYRIRWDIDAPSVSVGVADDGTFLSNASVAFTDLLGNHRINVNAASVSDFTNYQVSYFNLKNRYNWGATVYDYRDYFVESTQSLRLKRRYKETGAQMIVEYPFTRNYRLSTSFGVLDSSINRPVPDQAGNLSFVETSDTLGLVTLAIVGDSSRYQGFGPFQGKRFRLAATYGPHISGDFDGNLTQYQLDFRTYKQLTRRSLLAWRISGLVNTGQREPTYGLGGLNQLRGYEFREFFGSNLAWSNLELRFPLIDEMRFPFLALQQIRGFLFLDVGAAWYQDDLWYDPELVIAGQQGNFRIRADGSRKGFRFWDTDANRLQDGRAAYGAGFQFFFLGGLQFNWVWAKRLEHTQFIYDPTVQGEYRPEKSNSGGTQMDFYITFDF